MNTTTPLTEISFECPHCKKKSKLASRAKSDTFTVKCYYCKKETEAKCIQVNGQILIQPLIQETFHKIPLSFITEETPLLKSPDSYKETKTYIPLALEDTEDNIDAVQSSEDSKKGKGFLNHLKEDLVTMFNIQVIETDSHVPIFGIVKQKKEEK